MKEFLSKVDRRYIGLGVLTLVFVLAMFAVIFFTNDDNDVTLNNGLIKDTIIYLHDTVYVDKKVEVRPIPSITKYKVSDVVCAWEKWSGVIITIAWSSSDPRILRYEVEMYNEVDEEWVTNWYYDTELELGKCH